MPFLSTVIVIPFLAVLLVCIYHCRKTKVRRERFLSRLSREHEEGEINDNTSIFLMFSARPVRSRHRQKISQGGATPMLAKLIELDLVILFST